MSSKGSYAFLDNKPAQQDMAREILSGLKAQPKTLSPKYFYDAQGSALFDRITELDEYYLTRTEMALFDAHLSDIAAHLGGNVCLIEYGSGSSVKIRKLLQAFTPAAYVPVDISDEHLQANAQALHADFPALNVLPVCADFTQRFALPDAVADMTKVGFFPGSSIGNFDPQGAQDFLQNVHATVGSGGAMLVGVDRKKSVSVLEQAYNDKQGVTAAFNLNALHHINNELGADFQPQQFSHVAEYNPQLGCIQMFLRSKVDQQVNIAGEIIHFARAEKLHTENSYKYDPDEFLALAGRAGFASLAQFSDSRQYFTLYLLQAR
ncbi:MAG: L-histidine N(alpha)-methyltransferase [bacterium]